MKVNGEFWEIVWDRDVLDMTPIDEPDPDWVFEDSKGHKHCWAFDPPLDADDPTRSRAYVKSAHWVYEGYEWFVDEMIAVGFYRCNICGQRISFALAYRSPRCRRFMPGPTRTSGWFKRRESELTEAQIAQFQCGEVIDLALWIPNVKGQAYVTDITRQAGVLNVGFVGNGVLEVIGQNESKQGTVEVKAEMSNEDWMKDLTESARKLCLLMDDPQPGLFTWNDFLRTRLNEIARHAFGGRNVEAIPTFLKAAQEMRDMAECGHRVVSDTTAQGCIPGCVGCARIARFDAALADFEGGDNE